MEGVVRQLGGAWDMPRLISTPEPEPLEIDEPIDDEDSEEEEIPVIEEVIGTLKRRVPCHSPCDVYTLQPDAVASAATVEQEGVYREEGNQEKGERQQEEVSCRSNSTPNLVQDTEEVSPCVVY